MRYEEMLNVFWKTVEGLINSGEIKHHVAFELDEGFIYLRLQLAYPLYRNVVKNLSPNFLLSQEALVRYLQLNPKTYGGEIRRRFKGGWNTYCLKLLCDKIDIDIPKEVEEVSIENHNS
jgi:hypothetical protein